MIVLTRSNIFIYNNTKYTNLDTNLCIKSHVVIYAIEFWLTCLAIHAITSKCATTITICDFDTQISVKVCVPNITLLFNLYLILFY